MNQTNRLIAGILAALVGLAITISSSLWMSAVFTDVDSAAWLQRYAFWIQLTVNMLCFGFGLFAMSLFKVNIDSEIKEKGPLEKMTIIAYLLDELGYQTAEQFIKKHFSVLEDDQVDVPKPASPAKKKEAVA